MTEPKLITELDTTTTAARVRFSTISGSTYDLDFTAMTLRRVPGAPNTEEGTANLRRDGETVDLLVRPRIAVGERCHLIIDLAVAGVPFTNRFSTQVTYIEILDEEAGE